MNDLPRTGRPDHSVSAHTRTCPHCGGAGAGNITVCRACGSGHHTRCWRRHGGCGVVGCARHGTLAAGWSTWRRKPVLLAVGVTVALLALGMAFTGDGADGVLGTGAPFAGALVRDGASATTSATTPAPGSAPTATTTTAPRTTGATMPSAAFASPMPALLAMPPVGIAPGPATAATEPPTTSSPPVARHDVAGTVFVDSYMDLSPVTSCGGKGEFSGFQTGAEVEVTDGAGQVLATGTLGGCRWMEGQACPECPGDGAIVRAKPLFDFEVPGLPEAPSYVFRVSWKAWPAIAMADLLATVWTVDLTVG